jgi:hypothetical protein
MKKKLTSAVEKEKEEMSVEGEEIGKDDKMVTN